MKKNLFFIAVVATGLAALMVGGTSCSDDNDERSVTQLNYDFAEGQPEMLALLFGERQTLSMNSTNVDYFKLQHVPEGWKVLATTDKLSVKAPTLNAESYANDGSVELWAYNRASGDSTSLTFDVTIHPDVKYAIAFNEEFLYTEEFAWGETKQYSFTGRNIRNAFGNPINGWRIEVDDAENLVYVTAPLYTEEHDFVIAGELELLAYKSDVEGTVSTFLPVTIPMYKVDISNLGDRKLYEVYNEYNEGVAIIAREYLSLSEEVTVLYTFNDGYGDGFVFDNSGTISFDHSEYNPGTESTESVIFSYDGKIFVSIDVEAAPTFMQESTVTDHEGNSYSVLKAKDLFWMNENLYVKTNPGGKELDYYELTNYKVVGLLYTQAVALNEETTDPVRGICPLGWHIPNDVEFGKYVSEPATLYNSLMTNHGGIYTGSMHIAMLGSFCSTGGQYGVMGTNTIMVDAAQPRSQVNARCIKNTVPFK